MRRAVLTCLLAQFAVVPATAALADPLCTVECRCNGGSQADLVIRTGVLGDVCLDQIQLGDAG